MKPTSALMPILGVLTGSLCAPLWAQESTARPASLEACLALASDTARLACYDSALGRTAADTRRADQEALAAKEAEAERLPALKAYRVENVGGNIVAIPELPGLRRFYVGPDGVVRSGQAVPAPGAPAGQTVRPAPPTAPIPTTHGLPDRIGGATAPAPAAPPPAAAEPVRPPKQVVLDEGDDLDVPEWLK